MIRIRNVRLPDSVPRWHTTSSLFHMFTNDVLALSANGIGYQPVPVCVKWTAYALLCKWLLHKSHLSFLCFWKIHVYLLNSQSQKLPLCSTLWNSDCAWHVKHRVLSERWMPSFFNQRCLCLGQRKRGGHEGRANASVWRFWWLWMSSGLSSAHDRDNITMTTLSSHCGKSERKSM